MRIIPRLDLMAMLLCGQENLEILKIGEERSERQ
jgi:hypothetical protein